DKAQTLFDLNLDRLIQVPAGTTLKLPGGKTLKTEEKKSLGEVAAVALGDAEKAHELYNLNTDQLQPTVTLPKGTTIQLPQRMAPALVSFGLLVVLLLLVGLGYWLNSPPIQGEGPFDSGPPRDGETRKE